MWMSAVYCVGAFMACAGTFYTESSPMVRTYSKDELTCRENAVRTAMSLKAEHPWMKIEWRCVDYSNLSVTEKK